MKKVFKRAAVMVLCVALLLGCGVSVFANSETAAAKLSALSVESGYTLVPQDIDGNAVTAVEGVYAEVEKLELGFTAANGAQYAVFLLNGADEIPTESNIRYIDQITGTGSAAKVTIFPDQMAAEGPYYVYVSTASAYTKVASFTVAAAEPEYVLGDVNGDGYKDSTDALKVLRKTAKLEELSEVQILAADVNGDNYTDAQDALLILQYAAQLIDKFPVEQ